MNCPFCDREVMTNRIVAENELAFAVLTNIPIVPGHTLICSKRHEAKYENLSPREKESLEQLRLHMKGALAKTFGAEGYNYAWNEGESAGQSIPHFHVHVVPRKKGDAGIYEYEPRKFLYRPGSRSETPEEELAQVAKLIKANA